MMKEIVAIAARLAEVERRLAQTMRSGTVAAVNADKGTVRIKIGIAEGGGDLLSPWVRYAQIGGALKAHIPPSVGQQMTIMSPSGEPEQALALPMGFSDGNPSPSGDGGQNVITFGAATITLAGTGLTISVGGVTMNISAAGIAITGGTVTHNGKNIGSTHTHGGVMTGPANTSVPN